LGQAASEHGGHALVGLDGDHSLGALEQAAGKGARAGGQVNGDGHALRQKPSDGRPGRGRAIAIVGVGDGAERSGADGLVCAFGCCWFAHRPLQDLMDEAAIGAYVGGLTSPL
jgi:hypothetical protein